MKNLGTSSTSSPHQGHGDLAPEQVQVTAGALRAATAIVDQTCQQIGFGAFLKNPATIRELAGLTDQQTGAPEMLAALEWLLGNKWKSDKDNMEFTGTISCYQMDKIREAVAKAKGAA